MTQKSAGFTMSAPSSSSRPSYDDLSILYEAALQNYQNVNKQVVLKENRNTKEYAHQSLTARVELLRAVQCAALTSRDDDGDVRAAQALLAQTTLDVDQDALAQVRAMETLLPPQQLMTMMMMMDDKTPRLPLQTVDVDVNAFFEAYPECAKTDLSNDEEEEESSESSEDSDDEDKRNRQRKDRKQAKRQENAAGAVSSNNAATTEKASTFQPPATSYTNPYAKKTQQQQEVPQQSRTEIDLTQDGKFPYSAYSIDCNASSRVQQQNQRAPPPPPYQQQQQPLQQQQQQQQSWGEHSRGQQPYQQQQQVLQQRSFVAQQQQYHQSWEDHNRGQNPFQTAREYAWAGEPQNNTGIMEPQQQQQYQQQHAPSYNNPYAQQQPTQPPQPERPVIRESLKRKFQPPNKRASADNGEKPARGNAATTTNPPRKLGLAGGARAKATTAQNNTKQTLSTKDDNNNSTDDDDDLPEELKRFGKELVEKIESEIMDCGDPVSFQDIAGLDDAKQTVQEVVCWPMKRPDLFTGLRRAPNGLLLYGPPGTGKTLIGKAIAHESGATFFSISSSSLTSKWIGEGEKLVRVMFAVAAVKQPSVVFIDEIDSLLTQRKSDENEASRRIKTEFLVQLDGTGTSGQGRVLVIGATNRPQELDEAARRRFTKRLYIPLPKESDREILLRVLLEKNNHRLVDDEIKKLARDTEGYSGADLKALSTDAAMGPIRELGAKALDVEIQDVPPITYKHFRRALRGMKPSVAPSDLDQYIEWDKTYGTKRAEQDCDDDNDDMSES